MGIKVDNGYEAIWYYHLNRKTGKIYEVLAQKPIMKYRGYKGGGTRAHLLTRVPDLSSSYTVSKIEGEVYQGGVWFKSKDFNEAKHLLVTSIRKQNTELDLKKNKNIILLEKIWEVN